MSGKVPLRKSSGDQTGCRLNTGRATCLHLGEEKIRTFKSQLGRLVDPRPPLRSSARTGAGAAAP